jgi:UDP-3-O-[3-hydroxymyristoyl] glucosamine N-acyltransferase
MAKHAQTTSVRELLQNFPDLIEKVAGPDDQSIGGMNSPLSAAASDMVVLATASAVSERRRSPSRVWLIDKKLWGAVAKEPLPESTTVLVSAQAVLAQALIAKKYFRPKDHHQPVGSSLVHPSAVVASSARVAADVVIGPGAVIGEDCVIESGARIGAQSVLEPRVRVGPRSEIHPMVFIAHDCVIGADCEIKPQTVIGGEGFGYAQDPQRESHRLTHFGRVVLEDRVHIGSLVTLDRGTFEDVRIGEGTKIDNHCHFGHNLQIGRRSIITGGVLTAGSVTIGDECVIGGRTTINGHLQIASRVRLAGLSGVHTSIEAPGDYGGFPVTDLKSEMRRRAAWQSFPDWMRKIRRLLRDSALDKES